jgi:hypothetical protein
MASAAMMLASLVLPGVPANAVAPAPHCESGASRFFCTGSSVGTTTWTVTYFFPPSSTVVYTTPGASLSTSCPNPRRSVQVFYSYVSGGVTETSSSTSFICNPGDWP